MNAEAAKGCKERASTYERRGRKEMLALLTTHRVTRVVLVLVVCVCSIRLAGPAPCATMTGMADSSSAVQMRRWTRQEYDRMIEAGVLTPEDRVELIEGEILTMTPQGSAHFTAMSLAQEALRAAVGPELHVRTQGPLALGSASEPEPDIAIVGGMVRDYRDHHPASAVLVIEIADSSIVHDLEDKGSLYARFGIPEYWIVNLVAYPDDDDGILERSDPVAAARKAEDESRAVVRFGRPGPPLSDMGGRNGSAVGRAPRNSARIGTCHAGQGQSDRSDGPRARLDCRDAKSCGLRKGARQD